MGTILFRRRAVPALAAALFFIVFSSVSIASSRHRELGRLFDEEGISTSARTRIDRSYGVVLKAGGEKKEVLSLIENCLEGGFTGGQIARVLTLLAQLELSDLPAESFLSKIHEGVAKRVPVPKILAAAEQEALNLKKAENLLNALVLRGHDIEDDDQEDLIPAIAEALYSGKSLEEVRDILTSSLDKGENLRKVRRKLLR
ncbi:hypothetical protein N9903_00860 [bacterium]|nr:hypothetical protein [bacterium]